MRVAALSDVHGNLPALEAVLAEVAEACVELLVVGGDVVPGPMPQECLERLRRLDVPTQFLLGNGESAVLAEATGSDPGVPEPFRELIRWTAGRLDAEARAWLADWPASVRIAHPGVGEIFFCHATPRSDTEIFTRRTPEAALVPLIEPLRADLVVCGHTHMPFDRRIATTRVVNAGSVGMPFGEPGAHWLLVDEEVHLRRTPYDRERAADRILRSEYPAAAAFAREHVLTCPTEEQMLALYAPSELR